MTFVRKDEVRKVYTLQAVDYRIDPEDNLYNGRFIICNKSYEIPYLKYYTQKARLMSQKDYSETGSELDDKLLQDVLLYSLMNDPNYESEGTDWKAYTDPIIEIEASV